MATIPTDGRARRGAYAWESKGYRTRRVDSSPNTIYNSAIVSVDEDT